MIDGKAGRVRTILRLLCVAPRTNLDFNGGNGMALEGAIRPESFQTQGIVRLPCAPDGRVQPGLQRDQYGQICLAR